MLISGNMMLRIGSIEIALAHAAPVLTYIHRAALGVAALRGQMTLPAGVAPGGGRLPASLRCHSGAMTCTVGK